MLTRYIDQGMQSLEVSCESPATLLIRDSDTDVSCDYCKIFKNTYFTLPVVLFHTFLICLVGDMIYKSSKLERPPKKAFLTNFVKSTVKHLCRSCFFNKVADWHQLYCRPAALSERDRQRCTLEDFARFLYNLPKCPGGHPISHRGLKLILKISAGKYI